MLMSDKRIGVWLIGALGSIATTVMVGALALRKGLTSAKGMVTTAAPLSELALAPVECLEFGGCDVRQENLCTMAEHLSRDVGAVDGRLIDAVREDLEELQHNIGVGTVRNCGEAIRCLAVPESSECVSLRQEIDTIRDRLQQFRHKRRLDDIVVVNLASTEPLLELEACHEDLAAFEAALDGNRTTAVRASTLYAYAALQEGCPYINFTPSNAALIPAILELAARLGVPVMGNDGKTGETLVKSALAPMFRCRNLSVLSWEGFNILGNMDGCVLGNPENRASKIKTKDQVLGNILGYNPHSRVHIDYVPSLDDQKTAWDFIHFQGFLDAKMSLQFIWQGYDSLLAAPLILDLARLAEFAKRQGESGLMPQLASFFKAPLGVAEHRLNEQYQMLVDYTRHHLCG